MSSKGMRNKMTYSNKDHGMVPRLRFPEFLQTECWQQDLLGNLASRRTVKNTDGKHSRVLTNSAEFGVIDQRDYFEKDIANQGNLEGYYIVEKGDYVYNPRISTIAPVGPISKNSLSTGVMSPLYTVFRFNSSENDFFAHYFKSTHWHHYMRQASSTGARHDRMSITIDDFMALPLPVCSPKEQKKVASCLSALDERIVGEVQKLNSLINHKNALMRQLFPLEGENFPQLRFPEFTKANSWSKTTAGEIFSNRIERGKSALPIYSVTMNDGMVPRTSLDRRIDDIGDASSNKTVRAGDLAYNMMRMWQGALGVAPEDCMVSPAYIVLEPRGVNPLFFLYLLKLPQSLRVLTAHSRGLTEDRLRLYYDDFAKISLPCPPLPEQDRIADCLLSIDEIIAIQNRNINALKSQKMGLMQCLFPNPSQAGN